MNRPLAHETFSRRAALATRRNAPAMEETIDLRELLQALLRRKLIIIGLTVVAALAAYVVTDRMTPVYRAEATVLVQRAGGGSALLFPGLGGTSPTDIQNYIQILQSRTMAEQTAGRLGLAFESESEFREFWNSINVQAISNTQMIRIAVEDADPRVAAERANAVVDTFIELSRSMNSEEARRAREFIETQLELANQQLEEKARALLEYRESERVVVLTEESRNLVNMLATYESRRSELLISRREAEERLAYATSPALEQLRAEEYRLQQERAGIESIYGPNSGTVEINARLAMVQQQMEQEKERLSAPLLQEIAFLDERIRQIDEEIQRLEAQLLALPEKQLTLARYELDYRAAEEMYLFLLNRYQESRITEAMQAADVAVVDPSIPPASPVRPRKMLNYALGAILGLFVGVGLAFVLEFLDTSMKSPDEVERKLGIPVLGRIPANHSR